jgi:arginyl-tRNA synthetase
VNVEFVSANPTGPMHVGHTRGAVFGDALARLLDFTGHDVTREYYINDGGAQVDVLARSVYLRYLEAHGQEVAFEDGTYPGDYLIDVGKALKDKVGDAFVDKPEAVLAVPDPGVRDRRHDGPDPGGPGAARRGDGCLLLRKIALRHGPDRGRDRRSQGQGPDLRGRAGAAQGQDARGLGAARPDAVQVDRAWRRRRPPGDEIRRRWTYFAPDIAYHYDKVSRGFDELIDVFGADHGGYVKRMKAAVAALSGGARAARHQADAAGQAQARRRGTEDVQARGHLRDLRDVVEMVGPDVTRFVMLTRKNDAPLDFDVDKVLEQSKDNPVFYVQYAHARISSVLRKAEEAGIAPRPCPRTCRPSPIRRNSR